MKSASTLRLSSQIIKDDFFQSVAFDFPNAVTVQAGNAQSVFGIYNNPGRAQQLIAGVDDSIFSYSHEMKDNFIGISYAKNGYGALVQRSVSKGIANVEVVANQVHTLTLSDRSEKDYGQLIKVNGVELFIRHDFDEFIVQNSNKYATSVGLQYGKVGFSIETDLVDQSFDLRVGAKNAFFTTVNDIDEKEMFFRVNWDSWQFLLENDLPDPYSNKSYTKLGFGQLGKAYVAAGAGKDSFNRPIGSLNVQTNDISYVVDFLEENGSQLFYHSVTVGKFTYSWESSSCARQLNCT
ncbi:hypothetical protein IE077_003989 [Cardiosporidium cionae]|uniref:Uncharacterized protein n=1 Tax=Cardiosporidium cionae TaxID=476202 RepID=A0ABQ7JEA3_9APIC|nr:hypothetical protein IE077_003989 [Cardiosporidium cionae]|eukprot:KAF8822335.1 hypothetical protein IE077_003989 [Cardiosporidium cionae]